MLLAGQLLSALVPVAPFFLAFFLFGNPWASLVSALIVGFATSMPAYYVSWGRYPLLLAWLIFPVAAVLVIQVLSDRPARLATTLLAAVTATGLLLAHSRMGAFLLVLEGALLVERLLQRDGWRSLKSWLGRAVLINGLPLLILIVWTVYFLNRAQKAWPLRNMPICTVSIPWGCLPECTRRHAAGQRSQSTQ